MRRHVNAPEFTRGILTIALGNSRLPRTGLTRRSAKCDNDLTLRSKTPNAVSLYGNVPRLHRGRLKGLLKSNFLFFGAVFQREITCLRS